MKHLYLAAALALAYPAAHAQQTLPPCPNGTVTCNQSTQTMGDTQQTASANDDQSQNTQAGNKANSIASGVTIDPKVQQSGNAVTQSGNKVSATGGNAVGNTSANNSAANANNAGMNGLGGAATVGPIANTAAGGAGGSAKVGDVGSTSGAVVNGGATTMDASNHSKSNFVVMSDQPQVPMSISPAANVAITADTQCMPYQRVIQTPVYGLFFGITHTARKQIDHDDTLAEPTPDAFNSMYGGKAVYSYAVVNLAGARSISLGGFGSGGGGQGNTGTSSSMTAMVTHITMRVCRMVVQPSIVYIAATPAPPAPVVHRIFHKRAVVNCPKP